VEDGGLDIPEMGVLAYPELRHTVTREAAAA
jgi:hypothetical protein